MILGPFPLPSLFAHRYALHRRNPWATHQDPPPGGDDSSLVDPKMHEVILQDQAETSLTPKHGGLRLVLRCETSTGSACHRSANCLVLGQSSGADRGGCTDHQPGTDRPRAPVREDDLLGVLDE